LIESGLILLRNAKMLVTNQSKSVIRCKNKEKHTTDF